MAQGESRWNPKERTVVKSGFRVVPSNDYTLRSQAKFRVNCKDGAPGENIPYVSGPLTVLGTATDTDKDTGFFHNFFLTLTPRKEDGKPAVDLSGGLTELAQMLNVDVPEEVMDSVKTWAATDDRGETLALGASVVRDWLNSLGEFSVRAHVKKKNKTKDWPEKNEVAYFIQDEGNGLG